MPVCTSVRISKSSSSVPKPPGKTTSAAARIASQELGFTVVGLGTYSREQAREVRAAAQEVGLEALISDDYLVVEKAMDAPRCGKKFPFF